MGKVSIDTALHAFSEQIEGLLDGGVDLFILETFLDLEEIVLAIRTVREHTKELPIVASMTIDHSGLTAYGRTPEQIAELLSAEEIQVVGLNCSTGPQTILEGIARMRQVTDLPLASFANAGEPKVVEGRILYLATPEYFAEYTKRMIGNGVKLIGGCCGTGPAHIKLMASAIRALQPQDRVTISIEQREGVDRELESAQSRELPPRAERSPLGVLFDKGAFPVSCEIHPPRNSSPARILEQIRLLSAAGIDVVNIPDGPRASARMSPMALAHIIKNTTGMDVLLHYTCRDRNILGMQSDLLGAEALGLDNILCVTGDPPKLGDYPMATAVFDVDAIGLLRIASRLNRSLDLAANPIASPTSFYLGAGFNPGAIDIQLEIDRLHEKIESGAEYILTQPVFDQEKLFEAFEKAGRIDVPIMVGVLPLASFRNAEFFHNEVPGMDVPDEIRERMRKASESSKETARQEGVIIAQEALRSVADHVQGVYIMPPFGKVELAIETASILEGRPTLKEAQNRLQSGTKSKGE
jgi:homocysteine S-methyltransferase